MKNTACSPPLPAWQRGTTFWARETRENLLPMGNSTHIRARMREEKNV